MIFETFSRRKRVRERGEIPEVYVYDVASVQMRYKISRTLVEGVGVFYEPNRINFVPSENANR